MKYLDDPAKIGLPKNAKRVFEGVVFEVWQWEQELFDGTKTTFESAVRLPAVTIIATIGDKIIIQNEEQPSKKPFTSLPGGSADKWEEEPLEIAKRELLEETGCSSDNWSLFSSWEHAGHNRRKFYSQRMSRSCQAQCRRWRKNKIPLGEFR